MTPASAEMKCLLWNVEWAPPGSVRGDLIRREIQASAADVVCLTETEHDFLPAGHLIAADADYGYSHSGGRRKVVLWSRQPWSDVDVTGDPSMPGGRFASGITGGIRFVGVCIPWKDAHVRTGRCDRRPWEDHISYCHGLARVVRRYAGDGMPVCLLGDYNQRIPRVNQPPEVSAALMDAIPNGFSVSTAGLEDAEGHKLIDHIATTADLTVTIDRLLPRTGGDGTRLTDHTGILATLVPSLSARSGAPLSHHQSHV